MVLSFEGFMLDNPLLTTVGSLIGVSGSILSYIMCVAMNRSLTNVLFGGLAAPVQSDYKIEGQITKTSVDETVEALTNAENVILVRRISCLFNKSTRDLVNACRLSDTEWQSRKPNMQSRT